MAISRNQRTPNKTVKNVLTRTVEDVAKANGYRVKRDPAAKGETSADKRWLWEIPCGRGRRIADRRPHIYVHSSALLGYAGSGAKLRRELLAIAGVRAWQTGDEEFSVVFPDRVLAEVASVVKPYARRRNPRTTS